MDNIIGWALTIICAAYLFIDYLLWSRSRKRGRAE